MLFICTCEEREKEALELAMRPYRDLIRSLFVWAGVCVAWALAGFVAHFLNGMVCNAGELPGDVRMLSFAAFLLIFLGIGLRWKLRRGILELLRKRTTNLVEYRLTDDMFAYSCGETKVSLPLSMFKKYRIDEDAFYLLTGMGASVCVPEWKGRGVEKEELAAVLGKAGLKDMRTGKAWRMIRRVLMVALCCLIVFAASMEIRDAWSNLRREIGRAELSRLLHEFTGVDTCWKYYPDFRQWKKSGNLLQRFVVSAGPLEPDRYDYLFDEEDEDKVGIAATKGDTVWYAYLPCGCLGICDRRDWKSRNWRKGVFYKQAERDQWLEKVRRLAPESLKPSYDP